MCKKIIIEGLILGFVENSKQDNTRNRRNINNPEKRKYKDILSSPHDEFEIPIPGMLRTILIPIWMLTLSAPIVIFFFDGTLAKILYSFIPFLGIGILILLNIILFCPKEIITMDKGAYVIFRGNRNYQIPWKLIVFVPRKRSWVQGNEDRVGIAMQGTRVAIAEVPVDIADALRKKKEQFSP